ncbi:hypothetical protein [Shimia sp. SDUM112013]|uniref:hypothetical protein n=1 Tax=Shimia sp. SDUM112013 TaxID=3136160 RepID=UPI0032ECA13A
MRRLLIHAGFHKTGTSTLQKMLEVNRTRLDPVARIVLHDTLTNTCNAARTYSAKRRTAALHKYANGFGNFLKSLPDDDTRDILISAEDLAGLMPGRRGQKTYEAAPFLMKALTVAIADAFPEPPEVIFYFSLRDPHAWLNSCYAHHVRVVRMTQTREEFLTEHLESADLNACIERIRLAVAPHRVETAWLHDTEDAPLGPLQPVADLLGWSAELQSQLEPVAPVNVGLPDPLIAEILTLNQSDLDKEALKRAKAQARKRWKRNASAGAETATGS